MAGLKVNVTGEPRGPLMETSGNLEMPNVNKFPSSKLKLDEFFLNWLSSLESQKLVLSLLEDAKAGRPLQGPVPTSSTGAVASAGVSPLSPSSTQALLSHSGASLAATPPLSPQKAGGVGSFRDTPPGSPLSPSRGSRLVPPGTPPRAPTPPGAKSTLRSPALASAAKENSAADRSSTKENETPSDSSYLAVPRFYNGTESGAFSEEQSCAKLKLAKELFGGKELDVDGFKVLATDVCELPSFFAPLIMHRALGTDPMDDSSSDNDQDNGGSVDPDGGSPPGGSPSAHAVVPGALSYETFERYWRTTLRKYADDNARAFHVLRGKRVLDDVCDGLDEHHTHRNVHTQSLEHADFRPVIRELLRTHPGLEFLKDSPEFQDRYLETVTYRIFFEVNTCWNGKLRASEFRKSDLLQAMRKCDETDDVNKCLRYFSYEHFYVMYCKFWELDTDHDFLIDKEDLLRYGNHALTYRAVDRVFSQAPRQFTSGVPQKMGYEDFCWFVLSEEDKQNPLAQMYWLRVVDLDGDGVIRPREMLHFYEEQVQRMECLNQEPVLWEDVLCQMMDMLKPAVDGEVTINDLKKCKLAGNFFNVLFNLNKFIAFETRDPFSIRQEREEPHLTEWDRFARGEYIRLSMEEEEDGDDGTGWDETMNDGGSL